MEESYNFTKAELIQAFEIWMSEYNANPDGFRTINESDPKGQAELLIKYLGKLKK